MSICLDQLPDVQLKYCLEDTQEYWHIEYAYCINNIVLCNIKYINTLAS